MAFKWSYFIILWILTLMWIFTLAHLWCLNHGMWSLSLHHAQFQLYYETFLKFGIDYWSNYPPPSSFHEFVSKLLYGQENNQLAYKKLVEENAKNVLILALFDAKYPIDPNDLQLSTVIHMKLNQNNEILKILLSKLPYPWFSQIML